MGKTRYLVDLCQEKRPEQCTTTAIHTGFPRNQFTYHVPNLSSCRKGQIAPSAAQYSRKVSNLVCSRAQSTFRPSYYMLVVYLTIYVLKLYSCYITLQKKEVCAQLFVPAKCFKICHTSCIGKSMQLVFCVSFRATLPY